MKPLERYASQRKTTATSCMGQQRHYLDEVHASVEGDGGHGACVVVWHLHGSVPLAAVSIQQHPDASPHQLIQSRNLLHVHRQFEGDITQQGGGDVAGGPHPGSDPVQSPYQGRQHP